MQELVVRIGSRLTEPWSKKAGRPKKCTLARTVDIACMYLRHNITQEFIGDVQDVSQPTISRIITKLVPIVKAVLEEFVPDAKEAIEIVKGRVCLVDGTITPCWSYDDQPDLWSRKKGTTGFNAQLVSLLDGEPVFISDPLPGKNHDASAFTQTPVAEIVKNSGGGIGDRGYQGCSGMVTPRKRPHGGELGEMDKKCNADLSALRAPVERVVAHFKSWRILHTDYRRPYHTYHDAYDATRGLFFFSISWDFE
ncbi:transposase [Frankia sp. Cj3]|uniref:transposase n=1 Tax=Frankia sp. Cj3 TaxID=2880976 RepID=UPI001EF6E17A|nr:transposase [Frankia sp. Cj3]